MLGATEFANTVLTRACTISEKHAWVLRNEVINWICRRAKAGNKIRECIMNEWVWMFDIESVVELE